MTVEKRFKRDLTAADLEPFEGHFKTEGGFYIDWSFLAFYIGQGLNKARLAKKPIHAKGGDEFKRLALDYVVPAILADYPDAEVYCSVYLVNNPFIAFQVSEYFSKNVNSDDWDVFPLDQNLCFDPTLAKSVRVTYGQDTHGPCAGSSGGG